jgi:hypothetical protein
MMMSFSTFPGDDDQRLSNMQRDVYWDSLWVIVEEARRQFLYAEEVLRCSTTTGVQVRELKAIDHRTVQEIYFLIAAWYRFNRRTERLFPLEDDVSADWLGFLREEVQALSREPDFVNGVLDACIHAHSDVGRAGEERARAAQRSRYANMFSYTMPTASSEA